MSVIKNACVVDLLPHQQPLDRHSSLFPHTDILERIHEVTGDHHVVLVSPFILASGAHALPTEIESMTKDILLARCKLRDMRIGWFDGPQVKAHVAKDNYHVALIGLELMQNLDEISICTKYIHMHEHDDVQSMYYEMIRSWQEDVTYQGGYEKLPARAKEFIMCLEEAMGKKISYLCSLALDPVVIAR